MARRPAGVRREEILDAVVTEVAERGFTAVRVSDIAGRLGISTALVFYHFDTKDRLLVAALDHAVTRDLDRLAAAIALARSPADRVRQILRSWFPEGPAPGWRVWVEAWAGSQRSAELRQALVRLNQEWMDALASAFADGVLAGVFTCPDPDGAARRGAALLDGLAVQVTVLQTLPRARMIEWTTRQLAAELQVDPAELS